MARDGFLRLGVQCAVLDDRDWVLLSKRSDLNVWNLPGGRVDAGETLAAAARREVQEETGVITHVERAVGLYYWAGWRRLNVLYAGWPLGGVLLPRTRETRENRYFAAHKLPPMSRVNHVLDAYEETRPQPSVIVTPPDELWRLRWRLRWRWLKNLLLGRREPPFARFDVRAVAVIWDKTHHRVLTVPAARATYLPRVLCKGERAPWLALQDALARCCGLRPRLHWVGVFHNVAQGLVEFVFAAQVAETLDAGRGEWVTAMNAALAGPDADYVERVRPEFEGAAVWTLQPEMLEH